MGCTESSVYVSHIGFNAFEMEIQQEFPHDEVIALNKKCPTGNCLIHTSDCNNVRNEECYEKCDSTPGSEFYTFGEGSSLIDARKGLCIGCSSEANLAE